MSPFRTERRIEFAHCDPAGIVFYPRYFELVNSAVESFFGEALGVDFRTLHLERRHGVPTVRLEAEFLRPSRLGDRVGFEVTALKLGRTSAVLGIAGAAGDEPRLRVRTTLVHMDLGSGRPEPWPADLRAARAARLSAETMA
jgi:4-hydroxybenzoyl-CoA thioesterase